MFATSPDPSSSSELTESLPALSQPTVAFKVSSFGAAVTETILIGSDIYKISRVIAVPRQTVRDISTSLLDN